VNLQEAGAQALERCKELLTHAEDAHKRVGDIDQEVEKVRQQLQKDWHDAQEAGMHLLSRIKNERHDLETEAQAALALVKELHGKLQSAEQEMVQTVNHLLTEVNALDENVKEDEPQLQESLLHLTQRGQALKQKADEVHEHLQSVSQETEHHLGDTVAAAVAGVETTHEHRLEQLHEHIETSAMPEMEQHHENAHNQIDEHKTAYEESVHSAHDKTHQAATDALHEATDKHNEVFQQFEQIGNEAKQIMDTLKGGLEAGADTAGTVGEALKTGVNTTGVGLNAAIETFEEVSKFFSKFGFLGL